MHLRNLVIAGACMLLLASQFLKGDDQPKDKLPEPDEASRLQAESKIKELFKREYALRKPAELRALAAKFASLALDTKDDPATRFVLFREAAALAAQGGDPAAALTIVETLNSEFAVNALASKVRALEIGAKAAPNTQVNVDLAHAALSILVRESVANDQFAEAPALLKVAETAVPKAALERLRQVMKTLPAEVGEIETEFKNIGGALAKLKTDPEDAAANLAVGKFRCFFKSDWVEGLPLLAKGSDTTIKELAAMDLARPAAAADRKRLADGWWDLAGKQSGAAKLPSQHLRARALVWYRRAHAGLRPVEQVAADKRATEAMADLSALTTVLSFPPSAQLAEHTWTAGEAHHKLFKIDEGFCFLSGLSGKLEGFGEWVHASPEPDGFWYLKGQSFQFLNARALTFRTPYRRLFHAKLKEYAWPPKSEPIKMISKDEGFCYLSHLAGKFLGPGELIGVAVDNADGYWYLHGKSNAEVTGRAIAVRVIDPGAAYVKLKEYTWTPKSKPVRMVHRTEGMCCLSLVGGAFRGGGEEVRITLGTDGYWYLGGKSLQPTMTAKAMSISLVYTLPEKDRLLPEQVGR